MSCLIKIEVTTGLLDNFSHYYTLFVMVYRISFLINTLKWQLLFCIQISLNVLFLCYFFSSCYLQDVSSLLCWDTNAGYSVNIYEARCSLSLYSFKSNPNLNSLFFFRDLLSDFSFWGFLIFFFIWIYL